MQIFFDVNGQCYTPSYTVYIYFWFLCVKLSSGDRKAIFDNVKSHVISEVRNNLLPVLRKRFQKKESSSSSGSGRPSSENSDRSRSSSSFLFTDSSSSNNNTITMMFSPRSSATISSPASLHDKESGSYESYLGLTFYTEVPFSEELCNETSVKRSVTPSSAVNAQESPITITPSSEAFRAESFVLEIIHDSIAFSETSQNDINNCDTLAGFTIMSNDVVDTTLDGATVVLEREGLLSQDRSSNEEFDDRLLSIGPCITTDHHGTEIKLLGGKPTDEGINNLLDEEKDVELYTGQIIEAVTQDLLSSESPSSTETSKERVFSECDAKFTCKETASGTHLDCAHPRKSVNRILQDNKLHSVNKPRELLPRNTPQLAHSVASVLYHNIFDSESSRQSTHYSSSQISCDVSLCETTTEQELKEFTQPLSGSAVNLLKDLFGEKAQSLKTTKDPIQLITNPTSETLFFMPHVNNKDTVVHKIAIEDLCAMDAMKNMIPPNNSKRVKTPSAPRTKNERFSQPSSPTHNLLQAVVEKLVNKMTVHSLSIPEASNEAACKQLSCCSPNGPLSEFQHQLISRLCPVLVSDIMESLSSEIVSPDGKILFCFFIQFSDCLMQYLLCEDTFQSGLLL